MLLPPVFGFFVFVFSERCSPASRVVFVVVSFVWLLVFAAVMRCTPWRRVVRASTLHGALHAMAVAAAILAVVLAVVVVKAVRAAVVAASEDSGTFTWRDRARR